MSIATETKSVLAIADEVIASIGDASPTNTTGGYETVNLFDTHRMLGNKVDKSLQTERCVTSEGIQHETATRSCGTQCRLQSYHFGTQTDLSRKSCGQQTEPDNLHNLFRERVTESVNLFKEKFFFLENMVSSFSSSVDSCTSNINTLSTIYNALLKTNLALAKKLEKTERSMSEACIFHTEMSGRCAISNDEHVSRHSILLSALQGIAELQSKTYFSLSCTEQKLAQMSEKVKNVQNDFYENQSELSVDASAVGGSIFCVSDSNYTEDERKDESISEMKKLLTDCLDALKLDSIHYATRTP
ncbi:hypothetical protein TRVL_09462 [Trypanosoma vivax]|nr:hypothetical protein TRVL_09462 [Trypanosoma vivax]